MKERELGPRDGHAHARIGPVEWFDEVPGDDAARQLAAGHARDALGHALGPHATEDAAQPDVRSDEAQLAVHL